MIALYFALEKASASEDAAVWCYLHEGKSWISALEAKQTPFDITELLAYAPPHVSPRIAVQIASFTCHPDPYDQWEGELRKILIARDSIELLRGQLRKIGMERAVLFPDLDGIAETIRSAYSQPVDSDAN